MNYSHTVSRASYQMIQVLHSYYNYTWNLLDCNPPSDMRGHSLIFLKLLIKFGTKISYGVDCDFLKLVENYLTGRHERVRKIFWQVPTWSYIKPLLFLIYINDLYERIATICKIFSDDASLFSNVNIKPVLILNWNLTMRQ